MKHQSPPTVLDLVEAVRYEGTMNLLSKTRYLQYIQCPKLLWISVNTPAVVPSPSATEKARMLEGRQVEEMARRLFGDGILISHDHGLDAAISESWAVLDAPASGETVFRAVTMNGRLVAEMDIIHVGRDNRINLHEVKSGTMKGEYIHDLAFQMHVATKAGFATAECSLVTINPGYVRHGTLDPSKLFRIMDFTGDVEELQATTDRDIAGALAMMDLPACPEVPIGPHCEDCPLADTPGGCHKRIHAEPNNVFTLYRLPSKRAWGLCNQGFLKNCDIPKDHPLTEKQRIQIQAENTGEPHIERRHIREFIDQLRYPLHFMDFETCAPAIPILQNSNPYQQIPFQYSLHVQAAPDQDPKHFSITLGSGTAQGIQGLNC